MYACKRYEYTYWVVAFKLKLLDDSVKIHKYLKYTHTKLNYKIEITYN